MVLNFQTIQFKLTFKRKLIDNILILNIVCLLLRQYDAMTIQWDIYWPQNYPIKHYKLGIDTLRKKYITDNFIGNVETWAPLLHSDFYLDTFTAGDAMRVPDHGWSLSFDVMNKWQVYMRTYIFFRNRTSTFWDTLISNKDKNRSNCLTLSELSIKRER